LARTLLLEQRNVVGAKLIQLGLIAARFRIQESSAIALDIQTNILSGNFLKIRVFGF